MRNTPVVVSGMVACMFLAGCSVAGFGESVSLPQERHASLLDEFAAGKPLGLPGDAVFNLADSQRNATGAGQAESGADGSGKARCVASSEDVGTAQAEFQLGHVLDNRGTEPLKVTVRFEVDYECQVQCDPEDTSKQADELGLRVFIRDSNQRMPVQQMLSELTAFGGPRQWSGRPTLTFDVTLEPGLAYYFVLAGRASVTGTDTSTASAQIEVRSLNIELTPRG